MPFYTRANAGEVLPDPASPLGWTLVFERGLILGWLRGLVEFGIVVVRLDGDRAESACDLQAQHVKAGTPGGDHFIIAGRYDDQLIRTPDGWRIRERRLALIWTSGNAAVAGG